METQDFTSDLANSIRGFLKYVEADKNYKQGFRSNMRTLDDMCLATRHTSGLLDEKVVMALYPLKDDENPQAWKLRNCSLRQFAYYLHSLGKPAFVAPKCTSKQGPKQETAFDSDLGPWMQSLVEYKRAMGYKYLSNRKLLKQFDAFLINKGYTGIETYPTDGHGLGDSP
jgi:hypothetical protein